MANLKALVVNYDGERVTNVATGAEIPTRMPLGKKGSLELLEDDNGKYFVYTDGAGTEVYDLDLYKPGEYLLTTTAGEWLPSDEEKAAMREAKEWEERREATIRRVRRQDMAAGRHALNVASRIHHAAGESFVRDVRDASAFSIGRSGRWSSDGTITRTPLGDGSMVRVEITNATWARPHPYELHVWPGFTVTDEFVHDLGVEANVMQDIASGR